MNQHGPGTNARAGDDATAARAGDPDAFARLVARHQAAVGLILWRFTRDPGEWEGLVHDTFVEAYHSLSGYRAEAAFEHWLSRIATRVGYRHWKRRRRERWRMKALAEAPVPASTLASSSGEAAEILNEMLVCLRPADRLVLVLLYLEGLSLDDAADRAGWARSGMKMRALRARQRLAAIARARGITPGDLA